MKQYLQSLRKILTKEKKCLHKQTNKWFCQCCSRFFLFEPEIKKGKYLLWFQFYFLPTCGWNKRYVQFKRVTFHARLTSTQNRSRFLQAYARYFLYCNIHFVHKFFKVDLLEPRHRVAVKEYTNGIPRVGSKSTPLSAKLTLMHLLAKLATQEAKC